MMKIARTICLSEPFEKVENDQLVNYAFDDVIKRRRWSFRNADKHISHIYSI